MPLAMLKHHEAHKTHLAETEERPCVLSAASYTSDSVTGLKATTWSLRRPGPVWQGAVRLVDFWPPSYWLPVFCCHAILHLSLQLPLGHGILIIHSIDTCASLPG